jgi:ubiquinone/menaquinone biosynthesis C-methylase UbiE
MNTSNRNLDTGWGKVANWYESTIGANFSYQKDVILPAVLKFVLRENLEGKKILDVGCGTGFFDTEFAEFGPASILGIDVDSELLDLAKSRAAEFKRLNNTDTSFTFLNMPAENISKLTESKFDYIFAIESLVNMSDLTPVLAGIASKLGKNGRCVVVVNHPAFRIPQSADWYYDEKLKKQGRVVYKYKTAHAIKIDMNPGSKTNKKYTYTFHRAFEEYVNSFAKHGMYMTKMREVCSPKKSEKGPRQKAEDAARSEIPMFLIMEFATL